MWFFHVLIARGVRDAAVINRIVTIFKIIPILVFIVVLFVNFDAGVFSDNWTAYGYGDLGNLNEQVRNTMLITTFVVHRDRGRECLLALCEAPRGRR